MFKITHNAEIYLFYPENKELFICTNVFVFFRKPIYSRNFLKVSSGRKLFLAVL